MSDVQNVKKKKKKRKIRLHLNILMEGKVSTISPPDLHLHIRLILLCNYTQNLVFPQTPTLQSLVTGKF